MREWMVNYLNFLKPYSTAARQQLLNHSWIIGGEDTISWETQVQLDGLLEAHPFEQESFGGTVDAQPLTV